MLVRKKLVSRQDRDPDIFEFFILPVLVHSVLVVLDETRARIDLLEAFAVVDAFTCFLHSKPFAGQTSLFAGAHAADRAL
jgi:hypothetical protein